MLEYILSALNDAVLAYNTDEEQFMFISPVVEQILGCKAEDFKGNHSLLASMVHTDDRQKVTEATKSLSAPGETEVTYRILTTGGQLKWIQEKRVVFIHQDTGHKILLNIIRDVTEAVNYKTSTDHNVWFLSSLINAVGAFIFRVDSNGIYTYVNDMYASLLNFSKDQIIGKHISMIVHPDDIDHVNNVVKDILLHPGKVFHIRHRKLTAEGKVRWIVTDAIAVKNPDGDVTEIQGVGLDVTHQHIAQEEILWTKNNLEALINNTRDLVWSIDNKKRYIFTNTAFKEWVKLVHHVEPKRGMPVNDETVFSSNIVTDWNNYYNRALAGESFLINYQEVNPVTHIAITFEILFNPIRNEDGSIIGVGCFAHDITERLKTQRSILSQNERLRSIASLSSHELRRPVATLMGLIDVLDKKNHHNPENYNVIAYIDTVSRELDEVIRLIVNKTFIE